MRALFLPSESVDSNNSSHVIGKDNAHYAAPHEQAIMILNCVSNYALQVIKISSY